jgi:hypothetical protein
LANRFLFFISLPLFLLSPALCQQASTTRTHEGPAPGASFTIQLKYVKVDFPGRNTSTCIAVFADDRFHFEQAW